MTIETVDECAQRLVRDEVLVCLSSLIYELNNKDVYALDICDELFDLAGYHNYKDAIELFLSGIPVHDLDEVLMRRGLKHLWRDSDATKIAAIIEDLKATFELDEFCDEHGIEPEFYEAYEHWAVTGWFAARLKEEGERVVDLFNMNVWARTTTGQMIYMDGVVQSIAADLLSPSP